MTRRLLLTLSISILFSSSLQAETRPNIVLIMADDMGYECVGANGSEHYKTPNLDKLASEGIRFEHAYSQPICTPSRVQIMTGRYNGRNYVRFGLLHPNEITFGNVLKEAGYKTCIVGKWQLEGGLKGPNKFGFDEYCLWQLNRRPSRYPNPGLEINGEQVDYTNGEYGPDIVSDYLIDFIKRNKEQPFFAYYPMILPHFPFQPTPDSTDWDPKETQEWKGKQWTPRHFKDMVEYADKMVGKVDKALGDLGVRDNTILIFTCDNGTHPSIVSPFKGQDYKGGKASTPNAGTHVPMIANWPAKMKKAFVSQDLIDFSDILPTLTDAANGKLPTDRKIDGRSFLPQLQGQKGNPRDWTFCWYERNGNREGNVKRFARNQTYKLYHSGKFYNIPQDELEKNSLMPDDIDTTQKAIQEKLKAVVDKLYDEEKEFPYEEARKTMRKMPKKTNNKKAKKKKEI